MMPEEQKILVNKLMESHLAINLALEGVDLEIKAFSESDWRIREIIAHLATWDREVSKSLWAFIDGKEYAIKDLAIHVFNQQSVEKKRELTSQQVYEEWVQTRQDFMDAVQAVPTDRLSSNLLYPWGDERGTLGLLVEYMVEHDKEHKEDIVKAIQASRI